MISLVKDTGEAYNLLCRSQHIVGRNGGHLELESDQSISRRHALLTVTIMNKRPVVSLTDTGSKYGTFINEGISSNVETDKNVTINITPGDRIRFGLLDNIWKVEENRITVCTSTLNHREKSELKQLISFMGGTLVSDWNRNCNYLTVNRVTITVKVVCALANSLPVVNMNYWRKLRELYSSIGGSPPNYDDFLPLLAESSLNSSVISLKIKEARRRLFVGYTFIVPDSTHRDQVAMMVTAAGGSLKPVDVISVFSKETVVIQPTLKCSATEQNTYTLLSRRLEKLKLRSIPESEIGLAIVYCSMNMFCNAEYNMNDVLLRMETNTDFSNSSLLVPETESSAIIPSTSRGTSVYTEIISSQTETENKRSREDSNESEYKVKKIRVENHGDGSDLFIDSSEREQEAIGVDCISDVSSFSIDVKDTSVLSIQRNKRDGNSNDIFAFPSEINSSAKVVTKDISLKYDKVEKCDIVMDDSDNNSSCISYKSLSITDNSTTSQLGSKKRKNFDMDDLFAFPSDKKHLPSSVKKENTSFLSDLIHVVNDTEHSKSFFENPVVEAKSNKSENFTFSYQMSNLSLKEPQLESCDISSSTIDSMQDRTVIINRSLIRGKRSTCTRIQRNNVTVENFKVFKKGNINTTIHRRRIGKENMSVYKDERNSCNGTFIHHVKNDEE